MERKGKEWFGYKDGINIPRFFPDGKKFDVSESDVPSLTSILVRDKGGKHKLSTGSYMVFLKFKQHASNFDKIRKEIEDQLVEDDLSKKELGKLSEAYMMGRFKDGTPVTLKNKECPSGNTSYNFDYSEMKESVDDENVRQNDAQASRCPFHSHIRKANPRGKNNTYYKNPVHRRGMLYNDTKVNIEDKIKHTTDFDKDHDIGVLFISLQSNIRKQFENNVSRKLHNYQYLPNGLKSGTDLLTSKVNKKTYTVPKTWNSSAPNDSVTFKHRLKLTSLVGGGYFFAPSLSFFERIKDIAELLKPVNISSSKQLENLSKKPKSPAINREYIDGEAGLVRIVRREETATEINGKKIKKRKNNPFLNRKPPPLSPSSRMDKK